MPDLDWRPYDSRGTTSRVREIFTVGKIEYELCAEGGQMIIRRTDRRGKQEVVSEVGRDMAHRATLELWERVRTAEGQRSRL